MLLWLYPDIYLSQAVAVAAFVPFCVNLTCKRVIIIFSFPFKYNIEQRQKDMEEEKREEIQQLIRKSKNEQSEYHIVYAPCTICMCFHWLFSGHRAVDTLCV